MSHDSTDRTHEVKLGSDRSFGLVMAAAFGLIGLWQALAASVIGYVLLGGGAIFLVLALVWPASLRLLNLGWFRFGLLLHKVMNPLVMLVIFVVAVVPVGLVMRALGKRPLALKFESARPSYWVDRTPPGPAPASFKNQY